MDEEGNYKWRLGLLMVEAFTVPTKLSGIVTGNLLLAIDINVDKCA